MNTPATDLFGEQRIKIAGNPLLEGIANHILDLIARDPGLLDGDKVGDIDRRLTLAIWYENGLRDYIPEDRRDAFAEWFMDPKRCPDDEAISRARRYLAERDYIRLPQKAVQNAEHHRERIARSVK